MKNSKHKYHIFALLLPLLLFQACVEPIELETGAFEDYLVVETSITDEFKPQEVLLSRTFQLQEDGPVPETGATVIIMEDEQAYLFEEVSPGRYHSRDAFAAQPGREYRLDISTTDGSTYTSDPVELVQGSGIDDLYARRTTFQDEDGIALLINNEDPSNTADFYKYEYEETYKIISRFSFDRDLVYVDGEFVEIPKTKEETICYNTVVSDEIILASTTSLTRASLRNFLVRFIPTGNPISSRRYSIVVKQYALSPQAYSYYATLEKLSGSDNLFSQNQPGFVEGNIYAQGDPGEKVLGYFNVSSFSSKRIYFDYEDFYAEEERRPYFTENCNPSTPSIIPLPDNLAELLRIGVIKYLGRFPPMQPGGGPYRVVEAPCVDCTLLGTNVKPAFWEE